MTVHNVMTSNLYGGKPDSWLENLDFRIRNMAIYLASDLAASVTKLPFETRKQLVQMANYDISLNHIARNSYLGLIPLISRDCLFRGIILGTYYGTT